MCFLFFNICEKEIIVNLKMCCVMKKCLFSLVLFTASFFSFSAYAGDGEENVTFEVGGDVVSSYVWRGQDCGGFSVQPSVTLSLPKVGLSFGVWASAELFSRAEFANMNEFDLFISYSPVEALSIGFTDYHFCGGKYWGAWTFSSESSHNLELNLSYDFGPLALSWNTCLTGADYKYDGDRAYSSYVEASAPFQIGGIDCVGTVGACPWDDSFTTGGATGFSVVNLSLKASKEVKGLPLFGQVVFNPRSEATYFVVGLSF